MDLVVSFILTLHDHNGKELQHLMSWRDLEYNLNSRCYRIKPNTQPGLFANG